MGMQKRNKVSAEFSMSSLTDIIFLLLIFFMLTSTLVKIDPFELPESDSKTVAATSVVVSISKDGQHKMSGVDISPSALERAIAQKLRETEPDQREEYTITIAAEVGTPFDYVTNIMKIANRQQARAIIATQPSGGTE